MMTPFCWVGGGGDQENSTSLSPATAPNISGDPERAIAQTKIDTLLYLNPYLTGLRSGNIV